MKQIKSLLAALLVFSMIFSMVACSEPEEVTTTTVEIMTEEEEEPATEESAMPLDYFDMKDLKKEIKLLGERTEINAKGELLAEWSASGFEMKINVKEGGTDLRLSVRSSYASYWVVFVDGEKWGDAVEIPKGVTKRLVAKSIPAGEHTIRVLKDSQIGNLRNNYTSVTSFEFAGTTVKTDTSDKELFLEFIGDGYMTGFGALGSEAESKTINAEISATSALPYLVAEKLNADYSIVARSEIGILAEAGPFCMNDLFMNQHGYKDLNNLYEPERIPDAIVIHLGMDDRAGDLTTGNFIVEGEKFIKKIREFYGADVPVIWLYNTYSHTLRAADIRGVALRMGGERANVYAFEAAYGNSGSGSKTTVRFPSAAEHQKSADLLVPFLQQLLAK